MNYAKLKGAEQQRKCDEPNMIKTWWHGSVLDISDNRAD